MDKGKMMQLKKNDCLRTPNWVLDELGHIDLDPCSSEKHRIGKSNFVLEHGQDGLNLPWHGFVFCNPPFSQKELWGRQMINHGNGILLLPERGSAPWFLPLARACTAYWVMGKKINFVGGPSSNNLGSILFLFGDEAVKRVVGSRLPGHLVKVEVSRDRTIIDENQ